MKRIILSVLFVFAGYAVFAQDYAKTTLLFSTKKYEDAKKEIDKIAADPKGKDKAETYLWEAAINGQLFADSALTAKYPDAGKQATEAFAMYKQKDPSLKMIKESNAVNGIASLYAHSFNQGKQYFSESKWPEAFENFSRATDLSEFINQNGFNSNKVLIDTFTVLYAGYAAQNAGKPEDAVKYYEKLADLKTGGKDLQPMYQYMLDDYAKMKQAEKFTTYLAVAKELYPDQATLWSQIEMGNMNQNSSMDQIVSKYKTDAVGNITEDQLVNYAETFANPDKDQTANLDSAQKVQLKLDAADAYEKAFAKNPAKGIYAFNAGVLNYNIFSTLDERFYNLRGETAALKTQRATVEKQQQVFADSAILWLEKSYALLKAKTDREKIESTSLNRSVDYLANLYMWKRDKAKGVAPKDYDAFDTKFKLYDGEHDKYKAM